MTTTSENIFFWNSQGAINCQKHAPSRLSDTWINEQWHAIDASAHAEAFAHNLSMRCEICESRKRVSA